MDHSRVLKVLLLVWVKLVMTGRRVAENLLLDHFLDAWAIVLVECTWMVHRLEDHLFFLLLVLLLLELVMGCRMRRLCSLVVIILVYWNAQVALHQLWIVEWCLCDNPAMDVRGYFKVIKDFF